MKKHTTRIFILLTIFSTGAALNGFSQARMGVHFQYQPIDPGMSTSDYRQGIGGNLEFLSDNLRPGKFLQLHLGAGISILGAGHETRDFNNEFNFETPNDDIDQLFVQNMQFALNGISRIMTPSSWRVQPYVDFMAGIGAFAIFESIHFADSGIECEDSEMVYSSADWRLRAGGALGLMVNLNEEISLDFRGTYLQGNSVRYANLESVEFREGQLDYSIERTHINPWNFQVGIQVNLDCSPSRSRMEQMD